MNDYLDLEQKVHDLASSQPVQRKKIGTGTKIMMYSEMLFGPFTFLDKLMGGFYFLPLKKYLFLPIKKNLKTITKGLKTYRVKHSNSIITGTTELYDDEKINYRYQHGSSSSSKEGESPIGFGF